jgi:hypothetical protein
MVTAYCDNSKESRRARFWINNDTSAHQMNLLAGYGSSLYKDLKARDLVLFVCKLLMNVQLVALAVCNLGFASRSSLQERCVCSNNEKKIKSPVQMTLGGRATRIALLSIAGNSSWVVYSDDINHINPSLSWSTSTAADTQRERDHQHLTVRATSFYVHRQSEVNLLFTWRRKLILRAKSIWSFFGGASSRSCAQAGVDIAKAEGTC